MPWGRSASTSTLGIDVYELLGKTRPSAPTPNELKDAEAEARKKRAGWQQTAELMLSCCSDQAETIELIFVYCGAADDDVVRRCRDGMWCAAGKSGGKNDQPEPGPPVKLTTELEVVRQGTDGQSEAARRTVKWRHWCVAVNEATQALYPVLQTFASRIKPRSVEVALRAANSSNVLQSFLEYPNFADARVPEANEAAEADEAEETQEADVAEATEEADEAEETEEADECSTLQYQLDVDAAEEED